MLLKLSFIIASTLPIISVKQNKCLDGPKKKNPLQITSNRVTEDHYNCRISVFAKIEVEICSEIFTLHIMDTFAEDGNHRAQKLSVSTKVQQVILVL